MHADVGAELQNLARGTFDKGNLLPGRNFWE